MINPVTVHFVSFGAGKCAYGFALKRLRREIVKLDPDARVWLFDESNVAEEIEGLDQPFWNFRELIPVVLDIGCGSRGWYSK